MRSERFTQRRASYWRVLTEARARPSTRGRRHLRPRLLDGSLGRLACSNQHVAQVIFQIAAVGVTCLGVATQRHFGACGSDGNATNEAAQDSKALFYLLGSILQAIKTAGALHAELVVQ